MNIRAIAGKAIAAVALSGALAGLGAGVADARPEIGYRLFQSYTTAYDMALAYAEEGNKRQAAHWDRFGDQAYDNNNNKNGC